MKKAVRSFVDGLFLKNPLIGYALGAAAVVAASPTVKAALATGLSCAAILLITAFVSPALRGELPFSVRFAALVASTVAAAACVTSLAVVWLGETVDYMAGVLPFIVFNALYVSRAEDLYVKSDLVSSVADALGCGIGFTVLAVLTAAVREICAAGSICGIRLFDVSKGAPFFAMPAGGMLVLGLWCGFFKYLRRKAGSGEKS